MLLEASLLAGCKKEGKRVDAGTCMAALAGGEVVVPNVMFLVHFITTGEKGWDGSSESLPCKCPKGQSRSLSRDEVYCGRGFKRIYNTS